MSRTGPGTSRLPKATPPPPAPPKVTTPEVRESIDIRRGGQGFEVVVVEYAEGLSEERVIYTSASGPEAFGEFLKAAKKKGMFAVGIDLGAEAVKL